MYGDNKIKEKWLYCSTCQRKNRHIHTDEGWTCACGEIGRDAIVRAQESVQKKAQSFFRRRR